MRKTSHEKFKNFYGFSSFDVTQNFYGLFRYVPYPSHMMDKGCCAVKRFDLNDFDFNAADFTFWFFTHRTNGREG